MPFVLKYILSDVGIATLAFFKLPFPWNTFFYPFTFSLYVSFVLRCESLGERETERQRDRERERECVCVCVCVGLSVLFSIHSATLCLCIGTFKPFTFKVIIGRFVFIAILFFITMFLSIFFYDSVCVLLVYFVF